MDSRWEKMEKRKENPKFAIKITNFINPHLFHFKLEHIVGQSDLDIANCLQENAEKVDIKYGYRPLEGETISAFIPPWNKWVRAQVDLILNENGSNRYVIWCLDYGVSMRLPSQYLLPIPLGLQNLPPSSFVGGLAKCSPIEKRLNFARMDYEKNEIPDFPEYSVTNAIKLIEESAEIYFFPRQKMGEHIFGDIHITKYSGHEVDFASELANTDNAKIIDKFIQTGIEEIFTTKKCRYENHLGHLSTRNNMYAALKVKNAYMEASSVCRNQLKEEDQFILDWSRQNSEIAIQMEHDLRDQFDQVIAGLDKFKGPEKKPGEMPSKALVRSYIYGSMATVRSSGKNLSHAASSSTIHRHQSVITEPIVENQVLQLTKKLSVASIIPAQPNAQPKTEPKKKSAYIPSGFESDLPNFHKYNKLY